MTLFQTPYGSNSDGMLPDIGSNGKIRSITERHVACVLLLDTSGSMQEDDAIGQLSRGVASFKAQTLANPAICEQNMACIDIAVVTFGPDVKVIQDFVPLSDMNASPMLRANGQTPMGEALNLAMDMITERKALYNRLGTPYLRPWIYCITDGAPNDEYQPAARRLQQMEEEKKAVGYCIGVRNYDIQTMATIFQRKHMYELENLNFSAAFEFLSRSLVTASMSDPRMTSAVQVEMPPEVRFATIDI